MCNILTDNNATRQICQVLIFKNAFDRWFPVQSELLYTLSTMKTMQISPPGWKTTWKFGGERVEMLGDNVGSPDFDVI